MHKNFFLLVIFFLAQSLSAQVGQTSELYKTILFQDSLLFDIGFNQCAISQLEKILSDDFEFYHDQSGTSDKTKFLSDLTNGLCAAPDNYQARRELIPESTNIYALSTDGNLYGAIQEGTHQFYEKQEGQSEKFGSSAKFTHVWMLENGTWKLTRSFSFEHVNNELSTNNPSIFDDEQAIEKWLKELNVPALGIGIITAGELKQIRLFGEHQNGSSAPYNTIFNVASLTKPITAMVALKLISMDKWELDAPVHKYWIDPDIAQDPRHKQLTTRIILSHQTGFSNWRWMNDDKKLSFQFDPGTGYSYSGEGYEYLRKALEKKFKKSLQQLAQELIFQPLNMQDSRLIWDEKIDTSRLAIGYDDQWNPYETIQHQTPNGADDLLTTIEDYGNFLVSILNGDGLSKAVFDEMTSHQVESSKGKHFGLGFEIYDLENGDYALSQGGSDEGVQTIVFLLPKTKQGLLIFTNSDSGVKVYEKVITHYLGENGQKIVDIETK